MSMDNIKNAERTIQISDDVLRQVAAISAKDVAGTAGLAASSNPLSKSRILAAQFLWKSELSSRAEAALQPLLHAYSRPSSRAFRI